MSYENAKATKLVATRCIACGRALVDAESVEAGIGPVCRKKYGYADGPDANRVASNKLVHEAALDTTSNDRRIEIAAEVEELGFAKLAAIIRKRFLKAAVTISTEEVTFGKGKWAKTVDAFVVNNRWAPEFTEALKSEIDWRDRTVLRNDKGKFRGWAVKPEAKRALWDLVKDHFAGETGVGPKGVFAIA